MSNIFLFTPKHQLSCRANLDEFVVLCRDKLTVFGAELDWYSHEWPKVGNFTKKGAPARGYKPEQLLSPEIMSFAKAYVRYQQGHSPTKLKNEFKAIRCIEQALLEKKGRADITLVDLDVMDGAVAVARTYDATAYQAGISLVRLLEFLNESGILAAPIVWRNPIRKPKEIHGTDDASKDKRESKMPSPGSIDAMAEMFFNDLETPRDRFTTAVFAMCLCAPSRISEIQDLPLNCLHYGTTPEGKKGLGFRFYAGKGYESDIKWLPTIMIPVAEEAVRRLTELSAPGRAVAKWFEDHPDKFYRHEGCPKVGEHSPLTDEQVCQALGFAGGDNPSRPVRAYFEGYDPYKTLLANDEMPTLAFLNVYCHSKLPEGWPWLNRERHIRYSDALCCYRRHELRLDFSPSPVGIWAPGKSTFTTDINFIDGQETSIWERHGYKNADGSPIHMVSHQIRHYLNTLAQRGNLSQLDIARWSGRKDVRQNSVYNHMGEQEYVDMAREAGIGGALAKVRANSPVTYADLEGVGEGIAHVTDYGFCVHDFAMLPCQKHRDCLNCTEQVCVKGEGMKLERLKVHREGIRLQLAKAQSADDQGIYGADRWTQHQLKTLDRADQLIAILESPETPDGAIVRLSNDQEFSPLKRAVAARSTTRKLPNKNTPSEPIVDSDDDIDELRALMGV